MKQSFNDIIAVLGGMVNVVVDRPLGTPHPEYANTIYQVNYGYIPGIFASDGEEQDAYIIGTDKPLDSFYGRVAAVCSRREDENKWVVVPQDMVIYQPEIKSKLHFIEKYFDTEYHCLYEKSCGAVLYTKRGGSVKYLLVKGKNGNWGPPKGHVEYGESEQHTALREVYEETGLRVSLVPGFRAVQQYVLNPHQKKEVVFFLAQYDINDDIILKNEIKEVASLEYERASEIIQFENTREILTRADKFINT